MADEKPKPPPKTARERADEKRQEKLDDVQAQIEAGSLSIRKASKKELEELRSRSRRKPSR